MFTNVVINYLGSINIDECIWHERSKLIFNAFSREDYHLDPIMFSSFPGTTLIT